MHFALLGSHGYTITLAYPDELYGQGYRRFEGAPASHSQTLLEAGASHNLLPHLYSVRLRMLKKRGTAENHKQRTEDGEMGTEHPTDWGGRQAREL